MTEANARCACLKLADPVREANAASACLVESGTGVQTNASCLRESNYTTIVAKLFMETASSQVVQPVAVHFCNVRQSRELTIVSYREPVCTGVSCLGL